MPLKTPHLAYLFSNVLTQTQLKDALRKQETQHHAIAVTTQALWQYGTQFDHKRQGHTVLVHCCTGTV